MTNENQLKLEDKLLRLGNIINVSRGIDESKDYSQRAQLYEYATDLIAGPRIIETEEGKRENPNHRNLIKELRYSPEHAQILIQGNLNASASEIKNEYESKKHEILEQIASSMDKRLSNAKNKIEATELLKPYLDDFIRLKDPSQEEANEAENREFGSMLKIPYAFDQIGSTEHYKEIIIKNILSDYIKEEKEEEKIIYRVDKEKLSKITDKIQSGAMLYTKFKQIEYIEQEKAKEKR